MAAVSVKKSIETRVNECYPQCQSLILPLRNAFSDSDTFALSADRERFLQLGSRLLVNINYIYIFNNYLTSARWI